MELGGCMAAEVVWPEVYVQQISFLFHQCPPSTMQRADVPPDRLGGARCVVQPGGQDHLQVSLGPYRNERSRVTR